MNLTVKRELPRIKNKIIIMASGCFGDGDEPYGFQAHFDLTRDGDVEAARQTMWLFTWMFNSGEKDFETVCQWANDKGISVEVPCDENDDVPSIEEVKGVKYDSDGTAFELQMGY